MMQAHDLKLFGSASDGTIFFIQVTGEKHRDKHIIQLNKDGPDLIIKVMTLTNEVSLPDDSEIIARQEVELKDALYDKVPKNHKASAYIANNQIGSA